MRLLSASLLLAAVAAFLVMPARDASSGPVLSTATITVDSTVDGNFRDSSLTIEEAILLATGGLALGDLNAEELDNVTFFGLGPGANSSDAIVFDPDVFDPGSIGIGSDLPHLNTGLDSITADGDFSGAGSNVTIFGNGHDCITIRSSQNSVRGLQLEDCNQAILLEDFGATSNTIGGTEASQRNTIGGNAIGIGLLGADENMIRGNYIGTEEDGNTADANEIGIDIEGGDSNAIEDNVISGNNTGVRIAGAFTAGNTVSGNFIGTNASGTGAVPNTVGVTLIGQTVENVVGGSGPGEGNVISGNSVMGVFIADADENVIRGNLIGTQADGAGPLGNGSWGVLIAAFSDGNRIGGANAGESNVIVYNGVSPPAAVPASEPPPAGVQIGSPAEGNAILRNSIHSNGGLGIDLNVDGVTDNDPGDGDSGTNSLQNFPVITSVSEMAQPGSPTIGPGPSTPVTGSLDSTANTEFRVEFFANDACDPSGHGEGQEFVGSRIVMTDALGQADLAFNIAEVEPGRYVTATATNVATGDTSEFSECEEVVAAATPTPTPTPTLSPTPAATPEPELIQGDNDCDGDVDAVDALRGLQHVVAIEFEQPEGCPELGDALPPAVPAGEPPDSFGDVDCDGDVDAVDALRILQDVAALPYTQNEPCTDVGEGL